MPLPKQIRNQIKQNEEIEGHLLKEQKEAGKQDTAQAEIDALLNEVDPKESDQPTGDNVTELHPTAEGGDPEPTPEPKPERTDWKQKYSVLKGKYDAEVPRLSQEVRDANARITSLEDKLLSTPAPAESEPETARTDFTPEEVADYGEDLLEVIGRKARSIVESEYLPKIDTLTGELSSLRSQLGETGQKVAKQEQNEVFAQLDREVKDWRKTNVDPEFHEWLDQLDPFTGETRKALMLRSFDRKNAHQVKAFFESYARENAAVIPNTTDLTPSGQGGAEQGSTLNLEDYVSPGTPRTGGDVGAPTSKKIWSSRDISLFYNDVHKGKYRSRPSDKIRIEADIVAATREGRVQP